MGLGFWVLGLGFWVLGLRLRGLGVKGLGFLVQGMVAGFALGVCGWVHTAYCMLFECLIACYDAL